MANWNIQSTSRVEEKLTFSEACGIFGKALKASVKTRGAASLTVNLLGFPLAFLPMGVSLAVRNFSNEIQAAFGKGEAFITSTLGVFAILAALYVVQLL
jgi:hypothetical protein